MRFDLKDIDEMVLKNKFENLFMLEETWCKVDMKFISHDHDIVLYRNVRVIRLSTLDLDGATAKDRNFFMLDGVEAE